VPPATITAPVSAPAAPKEALLHALQLVDGDFRAALASAVLAEARRHAEAALNVSVGIFGRWYGDGDRDGKAIDPSDGRGILPGERVPGPPPDVGTPVFPYGLAFLALEQGTSADQQALVSLLGNVELWRSTPRGGYDEIESAVMAADAQKNIIGRLSGRVPRLVASARFILIKAQTLDEAKRFAALGSADSQAALEAARKASP